MFLEILRRHANLYESFFFMKKNDIWRFEFRSICQENIFLINERYDTILKSSLWSIFWKKKIENTSEYKMYLI